MRQRSFRTEYLSASSRSRVKLPAAYCYVPNGIPPRLVSPSTILRHDFNYAPKTWRSSQTFANYREQSRAAQMAQSALANGSASRKLLHCQLERRIIDDLAVPNINQVTQNCRIDRNLYRPSARVAKNEGTNSGVPTPEIRVIVALNCLVTRLGHGCLRAAISGKATVIIGVLN
jgi:hypothetical protein